MEVLKVKKTCFEEINEIDTAKIQGGWLGTAIAVAGACIYIYNNWDDFCEGFERGYNG